MSCCDHDCEQGRQCPARPKSLKPTEDLVLLAFIGLSAAISLLSIVGLWTVVSWLLMFF